MTREQRRAVHLAGVAESALDSRVNAIVLISVERGGDMFEVVAKDLNFVEGLKRLIDELLPATVLRKQVLFALEQRLPMLRDDGEYGITGCTRSLICLVELLTKIAFHC